MSMRRHPESLQRQAEPSPERPGPVRQLLAVLSLVAGAAAVVFAAAGLVRTPLVVLVDVVVLALTVAAAWVAVTRRGVARGVSTAVALAGVVVLAVDLVVQAELVRLLAIVVAGTTSVFSARLALGLDPRSLREQVTRGRPVAPAHHGALLMNLRSGGGKAVQFDLQGECRRRGIRPLVFAPDGSGDGDDLPELATRALDDGADVIGMAGGDGSQALVASLAAARGVPFVCIPAGTRNHFALDLGLDRDDVVGALDAFGDAVEQDVDLAWVNDRVFVNNVSLGVYAEVVQSDRYRDAKLGTVLEMLPDLVGPEAPPFDLRYDGPDGDECVGAQVVQVSNNPYDLRSFGGLGSRPTLDDGVLGIVGVKVESPADVTALAALAAAGRADRFAGYHEWSAPTFEVRADAPVAAGIDGEAVTLEPPLRFRTEPGVLRVRLPVDAPGYSPAALARFSTWSRFGDLVRVAAGRPVAGGPITVG